jgi:hypothetical protein
LSNSSCGNRAKAATDNSRAFTLISCSCVIEYLRLKLSEVLRQTLGYFWELLVV